MVKYKKIPTADASKKGAKTPFKSTKDNSKVTIKDIYNFSSVSDGPSLRLGSKLLFSKGKPIFIAARQKNGGFAIATISSTKELVADPNIKTAGAVEDEIAKIDRDDYDEVKTTTRIFTGSSKIDMRVRQRGRGNFMTVARPNIVNKKNERNDDDDDDDDDQGSVGPGKKRKIDTSVAGKRTQTDATLDNEVDLTKEQAERTQREKKPKKSEPSKAEHDRAKRRIAAKKQKEKQDAVKDKTAKELQDMKDKETNKDTAEDVSSSFAQAQKEYMVELDDESEDERQEEETKQAQPPPTQPHDANPTPTPLETPPDTVLTTQEQQTLQGETILQYEALEEHAPQDVAEPPPDTGPIGSQMEPTERMRADASGGPSATATEAQAVAHQATVPQAGTTTPSRQRSSPLDKISDPQRRASAKVGQVDATKKKEELLKAASRAEEARLEGLGLEDLAIQEEHAQQIEKDRAEAQLVTTRANAVQQTQNSNSAAGLLSQGVVAGHPAAVPQAGLQSHDAAAGAAFDEGTLAATQPHPQTTNDNTTPFQHDTHGNMFMSTDRSGMPPPLLEEMGPSDTTSANAQLATEELFKRKEQAPPPTRTEDDDEEPTGGEDQQPPVGDEQPTGADGPSGGEMDEPEEPRSTANEIAEHLALVFGGNMFQANAQQAQVDQLRAEGLEFSQGVDPLRTTPHAGVRESQARQREYRQRVDAAPTNFPEFSAANAIGEMSSTMIEAMTNLAQRMTVPAQREYLAEFKAYWAHYRQDRMHQAAQDMSTIPSEVIRNPLGDVQLGNQPSADISEENEEQLDFIFWLMRGPLNGMTTAAAWTRLLTGSVALGMNYTTTQLNWLVSGNRNGDTSLADFDGMVYSPADGPRGPDGAVEGTPREGAEALQPQTLTTLGRAIASSPIPAERPPSRTAEPSRDVPRPQREYRVIDGKVVAMSTERPSLGGRSQSAFPENPQSVSNIADPRYSERGGRIVPNVRIETVRNPTYDPKDPNSREFTTRGDAAPGENDQFINKEVPDVGIASKEVGKLLEAAEADRLASSVPFKLYPSIHSQAVDRFLGEKNYARLGLSKYMYFKSYTQQPFGADEVDKQYSWNRFVMQVYGPTFYAFVNDKDLWRQEPVFRMDTPKAVTMEFMELNELMVELKRYQMKSVDRSNRVADSAAAQEPIDKHLNDFFESRNDDEKEKIDDANAVIIAMPQSRGPQDSGITPGGGGGGGGGGMDDTSGEMFDDTEGADEEQGDGTRRRTTTSNPMAGDYRMNRNLAMSKTPAAKERLAKDMDGGVRSFDRRPAALQRPSNMLKQPKPDDLEHRSNIFKRFNR